MRIAAWAVDPRSPGPQRPGDDTSWSEVCTGGLAGRYSRETRTGPRDEARTEPHLMAPEPLRLNENLTTDAGRRAEDPGKAVIQALRAQNAVLQHDLAQRSTELDAVSRELDALSYALAHDLRTPARALDGFSNKLLVLPDVGLSDESRRCVGVIERNARRIGQMIDGLLACSRAARHPLQAEDVLPRSIVNRVLDAMRSEHHSRQVDIHVGELLPCRADVHLLECVFSNLISNALKFTRAREIAVIEIRSVRDDGHIRYVVKDNGVGFDMQYAGKLFGIFQRMHQDATTEGVGCGLALVQRIVQRHGGRVWAEAVPVQGGHIFIHAVGQRGGWGGAWLTF